MSIDENLVRQLIDDPANTLKRLSNTEIVAVLEKADEQFFSSSKPLLSDDIYDIIKNYLKKKDPKNVYLKRVGAVIEFNKEKLPYYLGSLDKIKDDNKEIMKWKKSYPAEGQDGYIISEKLDGISCLLYYNNGTIKMYSRGDGKEGQNITHILPYIKDLDISRLEFINDTIGIRGELIISRSNWKKISDQGANARNVVAGAIHSKTINQDICKYIQFVAYDLMYPRMKLGDALNYISSLNIPIVKHIKVSEDDISMTTLSTYLQDWRQSSAYEIDGIVVYHNALHKIVSGKNPKYAFAFKSILTQEQAEVIVTDVIWNVSKHGYIKPTVTFNEVVLAGVKIKQATGFNANYIVKNVIGPGSRLIIIRSGDVIPHITQVLTQSANGKPKLPDTAYIWNDSKIDIILENKTISKEHDIQQFLHFMNTLDVDGVKQGVITKLYDAGYDTLHKIINITVEQIQEIEGFKEKSAVKIYNSLQGIQNVDCHKLMVASNVFGRNLGNKKLKLIIDKFPNMRPDIKLTIADLIQIDGIAALSAKQFIDNLPKFFEFCEQIGIKCTHSKSQSKSISAEEQKEFNKVFQNTTVVFTGFRDKNLEKLITDANGRVVSAISGVTHILIVKNADDVSAKVKKAMELGIKIMTKEDVEKLLHQF
jgi:NAD-dependent DNA ligase